jgi:3-methyladenine DNA glycosylase AlkC
MTRLGGRIQVAEPLKNQFGADVPRRIAGMIGGAFPAFAAEPFLQDALDGYEPLELKARAAKIAHALRRYLPPEYEDAVEILTASLGPKLERTDGHGMAPFLYFPHTIFVAEYGVDHFEASMRAQHELTQRFTAEFSIRPFLERHQAKTLARLAEWTRDPSAHVRRLVSEGTRPRLPWAPRLRVFQADPCPVLALLELLKDDPELYVRRSVANNLNDIGKDNPEALVETVRRWMVDAPDERRWVVRHALRSAVKGADPEALSILGYGDRAKVQVHGAVVTPRRPSIGATVTVRFEIANTEGRRRRVLVDLRVHFRKASGRTSAKVFKLKAVELAPRESAALTKTISLADMTTRKHHPGEHVVEAIVNGHAHPVGSFELRRDS